MNAGRRIRRTASCARSLKRLRFLGTGSALAAAVAIAALGSAPAIAQSMPQLPQRDSHIQDTRPTIPGIPVLGVEGADSGSALGGGIGTHVRPVTNIASEPYIIDSQISLNPPSIPQNGSVPSNPPPAPTPSGPSGSVAPMAAPVVSMIAPRSSTPAPSPGDTDTNGTNVRASANYFASDVDFRPGAAEDIVELFASEAIINWTTFTAGADGTEVTFLGAGDNLQFTSDLADYTVLNRIFTPTVDSAIRIDGNVRSTVSSGASRGGNVWFYSPGGIVVGPTGAFDVGSLLLTSSNVNSIGAGGDSMTFTGVAEPDTFVRIENGATITAGNYVAMWAPRIEQGGDVRALGNIAYVGAEQGTLTVSGGLFDMTITTGTGDANGVVHTGTTGGPTPVDNPTRAITMTTVSKNNFVTMLLGGDIGYADASTATARNGNIILSAGDDSVADSGAIEFTGPTTLRSDTTISSAGDLDVTLDGQGSVLTVGSATNGANLTLDAGGTLDVNIVNGATIDATNDFTAIAGGGTTGGVINLTIDDAGRDDAASTSGLLAGGSILLSADALGTDDFSIDGVGGDAVGGTINIDLSQGGEIEVANDLTVTATATGGIGEARSGDATGGQVNFITAGNNSGVNIGGSLAVDVSADPASGATDQTGNITGGDVTLTFGAGDTQVGAFNIRTTAGGGVNDSNNAENTLSTGGAINVAFTGGTTVVGDLLLQSTANGSTTLGRGGAGGAAVGGAITLSTSGDAVVTLADVSVDTAAVGSDASINAVGGDGTAGSITIDNQSTGSLSLTSVVLSATGQGGAGGTVDGTFGFPIGGFDPAQSQGGTGTGGDISVLSGASSDIDLGTITVVSGGVGGAGGQGGRGPGDGGPGLDGALGGSGTGGDVAITALGDVAWTQLTINSSAQGGSGGIAGRITGVGGDGGTGGTAQGGVAAIEIGGGPGATVSLGAYTLNASATGGTGGTGGAGGIDPNFGFLLSGGVGGSGGTAAGGTASITVSGAGSTFDFDPSAGTLLADGTGGTGGRGGSHLLGGAAGDGGDGGTGTGGTIALIAGSGTTLTLDGGADFTLAINGTGGAGGTGGSVDMALGGIAGDGGDGGDGIGGAPTLRGVGGTVDGGNVTLTATGIGGDGGTGGDDGLTVLGATGDGGDGIGGTPTIETFDGSPGIITLGNATIDASGIGGGGNIAGSTGGGQISIIDASADPAGLISMTSLTVTANGAPVAGTPSLTIGSDSGPITVTNDVSATVADDIIFDFDGDGQLLVGGDITLDAGGDIALTHVNNTTPVNSIDGEGLFTATAVGDFDAGAGSVIDIAENIGVTAQNIGFDQFAGGRAIVLNAITGNIIGGPIGLIDVETNVDLDATLSISIGDVLVTDGQIAINAGTTLTAGDIDINQGGFVSNETIIIDAGGDTTLGAVEAIDTLTVTSGGALTADALIGVGVTATATGAVDIGTARIFGGVAGGQDIAISGTSITLDNAEANTASGASITLDATAGGLTLGTLDANGNITADATDDILFDTLSGRGVFLTTTVGNVTGTSAITDRAVNSGTPRDVQITAPGAVVVTNFNTINDVEITAASFDTDSIITGAAIVGNNSDIIVNVTGNATIDFADVRGIIDVDAATINVGDIASSAAITLDSTVGGITIGSIITDSNVTVDAETDLLLGSSEQRGTDSLGNETMSFTAGGDITVTGVIDSHDAINLTSTGGNITASILRATDALTVDADGTVDITQASTLTNDDATITGAAIALGSGTFAGSLIADATAGSINFSGAVTHVGASSFTATDDILFTSITGDGAKTFDAGDEISGSDIVSDGSDSGSDLVMLTAAGDITTTGTVSSLDNVVITSTGGSVVANGVVATDALTVTADGTVNITSASTLSNDAASITGTSITLGGGAFDGALTANATAGSINFMGAVTTAGSSTFTATSDILFDTIIGDGAKTFDAGGIISGADIISNGSDSGNDTISLTAVGNITTTGTVSSLDNISMTSTGGDVTANILQSTDALTVVADGTANVAQASTVTIDPVSITGADVIFGSGDFISTFTLTATTGDVTINGTVTNTRATNIDAAAGSVAINGSLSGNNTIDIDALDDVTFADLTTTGGNLNVTTVNGNIAGTNVTNTATPGVGGGNSVTLDAGGNVDITGLVQATDGNVTIDAGDAVDINEIDARLVVDVTAANALAVDLVTSGNRANFTGGTVTLGDGDVGVDLTANATTGDLNLTGDLTIAIAADLDAANGNITFGDLATTSGSINANAGGNINFDTVSAGNSLDLTAGGDIIFTSMDAVVDIDVRATGLVDGDTMSGRIIDSLSGSFDVGSVTTNASSIIETNVDDLLIGTLNSPVGTITLRSADQIQLGTANTATVNANAAGEFVIQSLTSTGNVADITLSSGTSITYTTIDADRLLTINAPVINGGTINVDGTVDIDGGTVNIGDITVDELGAIEVTTTTGDLTVGVLTTNFITNLSSAANLTSGIINSSSTSVDAVGNATVGDITSASMSMDIDGDLDVGDIVTTSNNLGANIRVDGDADIDSITAGGLLDVLVGGALTGGAFTGAITDIDADTIDIVSAGSTLGITDIDGTGLVRVGTVDSANVAAVTGGSVEIGDVTSVLNTDIDATDAAGTITQTGTITANGNVNLDAAAMTVGNIDSESSVTANATVGNASFGIVDAANNITITAVGTPSIANAISGGNVSITGASVTLNNGDVGGNLTLNATAGDVDGNGAVTVGGAIDLDATGNIGFGSLSANGTFSADAGGDIIFTGTAASTGTMSFDAVGLIEGGDIDTDRATADSVFTAGTSVTLGDVSTRIFTVNSGTNITLGNVDAEGRDIRGIAIDLNATNGAVSFVSLLSGRGIDIDATSITGGGNITSDNGVDIEADSINIGDVLITETGGVLLNATNGDLIAGDVRSHTFGNTIRATGNITTGDLSVNGTSNSSEINVVAGGDATIGDATAGSQLTVDVDGNLVAGNLVSNNVSPASVVMVGGNAQVASFTANNGTGDIDVDGDLTGGAFTTSGVLNITAGSVDIDSATSNNQAVNITSILGDVDVDATSSDFATTVIAAGLARVGDATSARGVTITGTSVTLDSGDITDDLTLNATAGDVSGTGTITVGDEIDIDATGNVGFGSLTANNFFTVDAGGNITFTEANTNENSIAMTAGGDIIGGSLTTTTTNVGGADNITLTANSGTIDIDSATAEDNLVLNAVTVDVGTLNGRNTTVTATGAAIVGTANSVADTTITGASVTLDNGTIGDALTLNATGGDVAGTGIITVGGVIDLDATGNVGFGSLTAGNFFNVDAGGNITFTAANTDENDITMVAGGDIIGGTLRTTTTNPAGADNISLTANNGTIGITSATAEDNITLSAATINAGTLDGRTNIVTATGAANVGTANSIGDTSISGASARLDNGTIGGSLGIDATGGDISGTGTVTVDGGITLDATGNIAFGSMTALGDRFQADAGGNISFTSANSTTDDLELTATGSILGGDVDAGLTAIFNANRIVIEDGTALDIDFTSATDIMFDSLTSPNAISLTALGGTIGTNNVGGGDIDTDGSVTLNAAAIDLGTVDAGTSITATATGVASIDNAISGTSTSITGASAVLNSGTITTDLTLNSTNGDIDGSGAITVGGAIDFDATGNIGFGSLNAQGGNLDANAGGEITFTNATASNDVILTAATNIVGGDVDAGNAATLSALAITVGNAMAEIIDFNATGNILFDSVTSPNAISLTSTEGTVGMNAGSGGDVSSGGGITLSGNTLALGDVTTTNGSVTASTTVGAANFGTITASDAVTVNSGGTASIGAANSGGNTSITGTTVSISAANTDGDLALNATAGDLDVNGTFDIDGAIDLVASGNVTFASLAALGGDFTVDAGGNIIFTDALGGQQIIMQATGFIDGDNLDAGSNADLTAGGDIDVEHAETIGNFVATAGGNITTSLNSIITGGDIVLVGDIIDLGNSSAGGLVDVTGSQIDFVTLVAGQTVDLDANAAGTGTGNITGVDLTAGPGVSNLDAPGAITLSGTTNVTGNLNLTGAAINFAAGNIGGLLNLDATAGGIQITLDGTEQIVAGNVIFNALNDIVVTHTNNAANTISVDSAANLSFAAQGLIDAQAGSILSGNEVFLLAGLNIDVDDVRSVPGMLIQAGGDVTVNNALATGPQGLSNFRGITIDAGLNPFGGVFYDNSSDAVITGTVDSYAEITIRAGGVVTFANGSTTVADDTVFVQTGDDIIVEAGANVTSARNPSIAPDPLNPFNGTAALTLDAGGLLNLLSVPVTPLASLVVDGSLDANASAIIATANAIDGLDGTFDASSIQLDIRDAPPVGFAQGDDNGLLSANCLHGNICVGDILADNRVEIGQNSNNDVIQLIIEQGTVNANDILITTRNNIVMGSDGIATTLNATNLFSATSTTGDVDLRDADISSNSILIQAAGSVLGTATLTSSNDIGITVGDDLIAGSIITDGELTTVANVGGALEGFFSVGGSMIVDTVSVGAGDVNYSANVDVLLGTVIVPGTNINLTAGGVASLDFTDTATDVVLSGDSVVFGMIDAGGDVLADSATTVDLQEILAAGNIDLFGGGAITGGDLTAGNALILDGGDIAIGDGSGNTIDITSGANILFDSLTSPNAIALSALNGTIGANIGNGDIDSDGDVDLTAQIIDVGDITSGGSVGADATNGDATFGTVDATNDITISATGTPTIANAISGGNTSVTGASVTFNNGTIGGDLTLNATAGDIDGNGAVTVGGAIDFDATGSVGFGSLDAMGGDFTVDAGDDIAFTGATSSNDIIFATPGAINGGDLTAGGTVDLNGGSIAIGDASGTNIDFTSSTNILFDSLSSPNAVSLSALNGTIGANTGNGDIDSDGDVDLTAQIIDVGDITSGGSVGADATNGDATFGTVDATNDITISATGTPTIANAISGGNTSVTGASVTFNNGTIGGDLTLNATAGDIDGNGAVTVGGGIDLIAVGNVGFGSLDAMGGDFTVDAGGQVSFVSANAAGLLHFIGDNGIAATGAISSDTSIRLDSQAGAIDVGNLVTAGSIDVNANGSVILDDASFGALGMDIDAGGDVTLADATGPGEIIITTSDGAVTFANLTSTGGGEIAVAATDALVGQSISGQGQVEVEGATVDVQTVNAVGPALIRSLAGGVAVGDVTSTGDEVQIVSTNGIDFTSVSGDTDVTLNAAGAIAGGDLSAGGTLDLTGGDVAIGDAGATNIGITSGADILFNSLTSPNQIALAAATGIIGANGGAGDITSGGDVDLIALAIDIGDVTSDGSVSAAATNGDAAFGTVDAANDVTIVASGTPSLTNVISGGDTSVTGASVALDNGTVGGDLSLNATAGDIDGNGNVTVGGAITFTASDNVTFGSLDATGGDFTVNAGDNIVFTDAASSQLVDMQAGGFIDGDTIDAGTSATLDAGGAIDVDHADAVVDFIATAGGNFTTGLNSIITGGDIIILGDIVDLGNSSAGGLVDVTGSQIDFVTLAAGQTIELETVATDPNGGPGAGNGNITGVDMTAGPGASSVIALGSIDISGATTIGGSLAMNAGANIAFGDADVQGGDFIGNAGGQIDFNTAAATGLINFLANGAITGAGDIQAGTSVTLASAGGSISGVDILAGGDVDIDALTTVTFNDLSLDLNNVSINAGGDVTLNDIIAADTVGIVTDGALAFGNIDAAGSVSTLSQDDTNGQSIDSGGAVNVDGANVAITDIAAGDEVIGFARTGSFASDTITSGGNIAIDAATQAQLGQLDAANDLIVDAGNIAIGNGVAGNDILLTTDAVGGVTTGALQAGANIDIDAGALGLTGTDLAADGDIIIGADGDIAFANAVAQGAFDANGDGDLTADLIDAGSDVGATLGGSFAVTTVQSNPAGTGAINISADQGVTITTLRGPDATLLATNGAVIVDGTIETGNPLVATGQSVFLRTGGNLAVLADATAGGVDISVSGDLDVQQARASGNVDLVSTGGSVQLAAVDAGADATVLAENNVAVIDDVTAAGNLAIDAGSLLDIQATASGAAVDVVADDIAIGSGGALGRSDTTSSISISSRGDIQLGGAAGTASTFEIDSDEFTRIFSGGDLSISAVGFTTGEGNLNIGDLDVAVATGNGTPTDGNIGQTGGLFLSATESVAVSGGLNVTNAGQDNLLAIEALNQIVIDADTGNLRVEDASGAIAGSIDLTAIDIIAATAAVQAGIPGLSVADLDALLGEAAANVRDEGFLQADNLTFNAIESLLIQNSGAGTEFDDRRGFTANTVTINGDPNASTGAAPITIVINGTVAGSTGLDALNLVNVTTTFDPASTVNGCLLNDPASCLPDPVVDDSLDDVPLQDLIDDQLQGDNPVSDSFVSLLVEFREDPEQEQDPLIDEPVTGAGNEDLWVDEEDCSDPEGFCPADGELEPAE